MKNIWLLVFFVFVPSAMAQVPVTEHPNQQTLLESENPQLAANKRLVFEFWTKVFQTRNMALAPNYVAEDYIQHNPNIPTGRQPIVDYFGKFERLPEKSEIDNLVSIVAERDLVVLAFLREIPDPNNPQKTYTTTWFDMFRIEDGKIAEHWDYGTK